MNSTDQRPERISILIADGIRDEGKKLKELAEERGFTAVNAFSGEEARRSYCRDHNDLIILDLEIPDGAGTDMIADLRKCYSTPLIAVSSDPSEAAAVRALDAGADEFIVRPLRSEEMMARIRSVLRHVQSRSIPECFRSGELKIVFSARTVSVGKRMVHMTWIEFSILEILAANPGKILPYSYIISRIWGNSIKDSGRALRVNIANIRRKIEKDPSNPEYIITENGTGYRMNIIT